MQERYPLVFALFLSCFLLMLVLARWLAPTPSLPRKPASPDTSQPSPLWVMAINVARQQSATAYTESPGSPPSASGKPYQLGSVAVHPRVPGGDPLEPIIPFGTTIHLINPDHISVAGQEFSSFEVADTGDVNWSLRGESPFWIDIYYGPTSTWTFREASRHGVAKVDFYWFHIKLQD